MRSTKKSDEKIPVIDLFAGPGGLGEGFAAYEVKGPDGKRRHPFEVVLSVEKDRFAWETLRLRKFFRACLAADNKKALADYHRYVSGELEFEDLWATHQSESDAAERSAWLFTLGEHKHYEGAFEDYKGKSLDDVISTTTKGRPWVLVGGPPCQAYSLVGRSRRKSTDPEFENDHKHFLYEEYLHIVARHKPDVFVMENVKGLLSATNSKVKEKGEQRTLQGSAAGTNKVIDLILADLERPGRCFPELAEDTNYRLTPLGQDAQEAAEEERLRDDAQMQLGLPRSAEPKHSPQSYVVRAEKYGIPQARHRVMILGVRGDIEPQPGTLKKGKHRVPAEKALKDLPRLRSTISPARDDDFEEWKKALADTATAIAGDPVSDELAATLAKKIAKLPKRERPASSARYANKPGPLIHKKWYRAHTAEGTISCHDARGHMREDLQRYFFAACFAELEKRAPTLKDFPQRLLPKHRNAEQGRAGKMFADRFRVQIKGRPSTTITSHIAKDGHYFIHYDPLQCRSLTVREAARLQTFPDSYFFEGPRTEQYKQVGNAVPPLLARQIAKIVSDLLREARKRPVRSGKGRSGKA